MPNDTESPESWLARAALLKEKHNNGNGAGMPLAVAVKIADWPTPRASENENRQTKASPSQLAGEHGWSLGAAVNHQWPTPNACGPANSTTLTCSGDGRGKPNKLGWAVAIEPRTAHPSESTRSTPTVNAAQNATAGPSQRLRNTPGLAAEADASAVAPLNPAWVAALMGFPDGWTVTAGPRVAVKRSTPASPRARRRAS